MEVLHSRALISLLGFLCSIILAMAPAGQAHNSPGDYLMQHNEARRLVGVGPMTWDNTVAAYAQNYANQRASDCRLIHSHGPYGENLFWGSGNGWTAADAVRLWVAEKQWYNPGTNKCAPGKQCLHYTQVVWRNSIRLGCARVNCANGGTFIICNYDPHGNIIGQVPY